MSNVVGTLNYLEAARHGGVGRFVFASSGGTVVGEAEPPIHEEMVRIPSRPTGRASWPARATVRHTSRPSA